MRRRTLVIQTAILFATLLAVGAYLINASQQRQAAELARTNAEALVRPHSPILGPEDAPVTIVEFFDPACEACRAFYPVVKSILEEHENQVRLVIRYTPFHEESMEAIGIIEAARAQDIYEPVLEALMYTQPLWAVHGAPNMEVAWEVAESMGLNVEEAQTVADSAETLALIDLDTADLEQLEVRQTPTFYVNGEPLTDYSFNGLIAMVQQAITTSGAQ